MAYVQQQVASSTKYLQDYRRHSVAVSQRKNDHIQANIFFSYEMVKWWVVKQGQG